MSSYIILYDTENKVGVKTTSDNVCEKLKTKYQNLVDIAYVSGRDCEVTSSSSVEIYNAKEYEELIKNKEEKLKHKETTC